MTLYALIYESGCGDPECCGNIDHHVEAITDDINLAKKWESKGNTYKEFELNTKYGKSLDEALYLK